MDKGNKAQNKKRQISEENGGDIGAHQYIFPIKKKNKKDKKNKKNKKHKDALLKLTEETSPNKPLINENTSLEGEDDLKDQSAPKENIIEEAVTDGLTLDEFLKAKGQNRANKRRSRRARAEKSRIPVSNENDDRCQSNRDVNAANPRNKANPDDFVEEVNENVEEVNEDAYEDGCSQKITKSYLDDDAAVLDTRATYAEDLVA